MSVGGRNDFKRLLDEIKTTESLVDITHLLTKPINEAAQTLNTSPATLSKKWKKIAGKRKWPHRRVMQLDKEILILANLLPAENDDPELKQNIQKALRALIDERGQELRTTKIFINYENKQSIKD